MERRPQRQRDRDKLMLDKILDVASAALPPPDERPAAVKRWRLTVGIWQMLITFFGAFHVAWACSWLPGIPGFAMAADAHEIKQAVDELRQNLLEKAIFDTRILQCTAMEEGNGRVYAEKLRGFLVEYKETTGHDYPLPACDEL